MQDLGVPVDSVSLAVRAVNKEYHTARSKQVSFVSALGADVIRWITRDMISACRGANRHQVLQARLG